MAMAPRRLACARASGWASRWGLQQLGRAGWSAEVKRSTSPDFMYVASSPFLLADQEREEESLTLSAPQLAHAVTQPSPPFYYFTAMLESLEPGLSDSLDGWRELAARSGASRPWVQIWTASAGAFTQAHYDVADNYFVQCDGRKEVLLWPPATADVLQPFPDAHPRARKAQVNVCAALAEERALSEKERRAQLTHREMFPGRAPKYLPQPTRVSLSPGDVLYIPAFWFHHVISETPTLSLNVFAPSATAEAAAAVLAEPLPLSPSWPTPILRSAIATLLDDLLARGVLSGGFVSGGNVMSRGVLAGGGDRRKDVIRRLLYSRYSPLSESVQVAGGGNVGQTTDAAAVTGGSRKRRAPPPRLEESVAAMVAEHAEATSARFDELREAIVAQQQAGQLGLQEDAIEPMASATACGVTAPRVEDDHYNAWQHYEGVSALLVAHLLEMWSLRLFGAANVEAELGKIAEAQPLDHAQSWR